MATSYWSTPGGAYFQTEAGDTAGVGWTSITLAAYNAALASVGAAIAAQQALNQTNACLGRKAAYQWFIDAGAPPAIAFASTGYVVGSC